MNLILQCVLRHGVVVLFAALFLHQMGIPAPGALLVVAAGALAAQGKLGVVSGVGVTIATCVMADWIWYEAGRLRGDRVLHLMHRFARDPESHDRRARATFARYGLALLLIAKFVPVLDAVAPPLAGTSRANRVTFLLLDAVGAALYALAYGGLGFFFSHDLTRATAWVAHAGRMMGTLAVAAIFIFVLFTFLRRCRRIGDSLAWQGPQTEAAESAQSIQMPCVIAGGDENGV